jgi:multidrug resistance efflux pump
MRPALFVVGVAILLGSVVGARALTNGNGKGNNEQPKTVNPAPTAKLSGPIVLGTVDSEPSPVPYLLPPVLQSGTVVQVFVRSGQEVKVGDNLYEFDTSLQKADLENASAAVAIAQRKVDVVKEKTKQHATEVDIAKKIVAAAEEKKRLQGNHYNLVKSSLETSYKSQNYPEDTWPKRLQDDPNLYKANVEYVAALNELELAKAKLAGLEADDPKVYLREAEAGVEQAKAAERKAQTAIDLCTVKAKTAGTVERVTIGSGTTLGIGTRDPALWLVPAGKRIVRAEVEAEFAHRVGKNLEGKQATVFDHTDSTLTYTGTVRTIGGTFLPKRSVGDSLLGNDTRVLEAVIEIADPAPSGKDKPPLRVGQRVRVGLGQ